MLRNVHSRAIWLGRILVRGGIPQRIRSPVGVLSRHHLIERVGGIRSRRDDALIKESSEAVKKLAGHGRDPNAAATGCYHDGQMASDFISVFRDALLDFLAPLDEAANNPAVLQAWLAQLGHTAAISGAPELSEIFAHAGALRATLAGLNPSSLQTLAGLQSLLQSGRDVSALVQELREFGNDPARANVAAELGEKVMALLLASYLRRNEMPLFRAASVFTLIASSETSLPAPAIVV